MNRAEQYRALSIVHRAFNLDQTDIISKRFNDLDQPVVFAGGPTRCSSEKLDAVLAFTGELLQVVQIARYEVPRDLWQPCLDDISDVALVVEFLRFCGRDDDAEWVAEHAIRFSDVRLTEDPYLHGKGKVTRMDGSWHVVGRSTVDEAVDGFDARYHGPRVRVGDRIYVSGDLSRYNSGTQFLVEVVGSPKSYTETVGYGQIDEDRSADGVVETEVVAEKSVRFSVSIVRAFDPCVAKIRRAQL